MVLPCLSTILGIKLRILVYIVCVLQPGLPPSFAHHFPSPWNLSSKFSGIQGLPSLSPMLGISFSLDAPPRLPCLPIDSSSPEDHNTNISSEGHLHQHTKFHRL